MKKLIEVSLPLSAINAESVREKSIRHGHPSTLHLWWARRPLASARAVIWASLVDDPSSHPELFPTEAEQNKERERLHKLLADLVKWENSNNAGLLAKAKAEIRKSMGTEPLFFLDPFAGGGALPLEAQRLGLEAHAQDLNPVAVLINKAMLEIPPKFANRAPVNPESSPMLGKWPGAHGLAEDLRYYGHWLKEEAHKRIGQFYPKIKLENGEEATVIAWIWARTITCPNPACGCEMPLIKSFDLSKKSGQEHYIEAQIDGKNLSYTVKKSSSTRAGTVNRGGAKCLCCNSPVSFNYINEQGKAGKMQSRLLAIVAEGKNCRIYLSANSEHSKIAELNRPEKYPDGELFGKAKVNVGNYGLTNFSDLFSPRQLTALTTFSDLISEAAAKAEQDALAAGFSADTTPLNAGGTGAKAYGEAIGVYLAFVLDRLSDRNSTIASWDSSYLKIRNTFGRQAIPMTWDYAEANPFNNSSGGFDNMLGWIIKVLKELPTQNLGQAIQKSAQSGTDLANPVISTDPPYYDNIAYADLSDYFYIWLRKALKNTYPELFKTMLVPKAEELVATPYRFNGNKAKAKGFFEKGMLEVFKKLWENARKDVPVTIFYAYKQSDQNAKEGTSSSGWETMLKAIIQAGFTITGTWPLSTEKPGRSIEIGANALASSIVLVCRKRKLDAPAISRRQFFSELKKAMPKALSKLQQSQISQVDMSQAAIGPGMAVFSKYAKVLEADGKPLSVRAALQAINTEIDNFYSSLYGELDSASQFCVDLFTQKGYAEMSYSEADVLARAKNIAVDKIAAFGLLKAEKGRVRLLSREELPNEPNRNQAEDISLWALTQHLVKAFENKGIEGASKIAANFPDKAEKACELARRLFDLSDRKNLANDAFAYNSFVDEWQDIDKAANQIRIGRLEYGDLFEKNKKK